jgi:polygalacturonase
VVSNVTFKDSTVQNSVQGKTQRIEAASWLWSEADPRTAIRVKTVAGTTGSVTGVTYSGLTLKNITK